jgi:hypothetical protein
VGPAGFYAEIEPVPVTDSMVLAACATCWIVPPARPQQAGIVITPMTGRHTGGSYCGDFCVVGHQLQDRCDLRAGQVHQRADELGLRIPLPQHRFGSQVPCSCRQVGTLGLRRILPRLVRPGP